MPPGQPGTLSAGDAIGAAWNVFKANIATFVGLAAILLVGVAAVSGVSLAAAPDSTTVSSSISDDSPISALFPAQSTGPVTSFLNLLMNVLTFVITCAMLKAAHVALETGRVSFGQSFAGISWVPALAVSIVVSLAQALGGVVTCGIGFFVLPVLFMFAMPAVIAGDSIGDSLGTVTSLVTKNLGSSFALFYLCVVIVILGMLACLLPGILVAMPLMYIAITYGYRVLTGKPVNM